MPSAARPRHPRHADAVTPPPIDANGDDSAAKARDAAAEKNRPLVEDIRLLGRILGEVIREQEGRDAYELIERVRQLSVAYRLKQDDSAGKALGRLLKNLSADQTVSVIRAFSYFSHLANIAEDRARRFIAWNAKLARSSLRGQRVADAHGRAALLEWAGAIIDLAATAKGPDALAAAPRGPAAPTLASYIEYLEALVAAVA